MLIDGKKVKDIRQKMTPKHTTGHLAVAADMSPAWVVKLENGGVRDVNEHIAKAIVRALKCRQEEIQP
jgi:predicted transcriptional regulator